jgi:hypothetical protein
MKHEPKPHWHLAITSTASIAQVGDTQLWAKSPSTFETQTAEVN